MNVKILFDDDSTKEVSYSGQMTFPQWAEGFVKCRYFVLNPTSEKGNLLIDTSKVKYVELL